ETTAHEAIYSRATTLFFDPTNLEVHRAVAKWFWDQEIHDFIGRHLLRMPPLNQRCYLAAANDKRARRDWRRHLLAAYSPDMQSSLVQELELANMSREAKADAFEKSMAGIGGASHRTYLRVRNRLRREGRLVVSVVPPIPLRHTRPPANPSPVELES